jgi:hypothetical protein
MGQKISQVSRSSRVTHLGHKSGGSTPRQVPWLSTQPPQPRGRSQRGRPTCCEGQRRCYAAEVVEYLVRYEIY